VYTTEPKDCITVEKTSWGKDGRVIAGEAEECSDSTSASAGHAGDFSARVPDLGGSTVDMSADPMAGAGRLGASPRQGFLPYNSL